MNLCFILFSHLRVHLIFTILSSYLHNIIVLKEERKEGKKVKKGTIMNFEDSQPLLSSKKSLGMTSLSSLLLSLFSHYLQCRNLWYFGAGFRTSSASASYSTSRVSTYPLFALIVTNKFLTLKLQSAISREHDQGVRGRCQSWSSRDRDRYRQRIKIQAKSYYS